VDDLGVKAALGKLVLHQPVRDLCRELEREFGVRTLPVSLAHVLQLGALAHHHGDPFDRLLIAQAQVEGLTIVTRDAEFSRYGVPIVAA
jgi:PIN domain nuclease of toxin-antitoxin system